MLSIVVMGQMKLLSDESISKSTEVNGNQVKHNELTKFVFVVKKAPLPATFSVSRTCCRVKTPPQSLKDFLILLIIFSFVTLINFVTSVFF